MKPQTLLLPLTDEAFASFAEEAVTSYAQSSIESSRWRPEDALPRARQEFERLLHLGLHTPGHHIYEIRDGRSDETVGHLWFAVQDAGPTRAGYIYNILVQPAFRGRGHAKAALELAEPLAAAEGATSLGLHVFAFNTGAQALYRSLGYGITGLNMYKPLRSDED